MRIIILIVVFLAAVTSLEAQVLLPGSFINDNYRGNALNTFKDSNNTGKKWFVSKYSSISTTFSFFNGGHATVLAAPMGIQLNRKLNNNLFAFGRAFIAPSYIDFRSSMINNSLKNGLNVPYQAKGLGVMSRAELGLQYVNDERTFSISGSFGVERRDFPLRFDNGRNNNIQQQFKR